MRPALPQTSFRFQLKGHICHVSAIGSEVVSIDLHLPSAMLTLNMATAEAADMWAALNQVLQASHKASVQQDATA